MNHHAWADSMADWAAENADKLHKLPHCAGDCEQGRKACNCPTAAAECCTEIGADDQSDSADGLVIELLAKGFLYIVMVALCVHIVAVFWQA
jgi:hypothetical protein